MTNEEFIGKVSYFLSTVEYFIDNIDTQCACMLEEDFLSDNLINNFINYVDVISQDYKKEWEKIKEERENLVKS